ncbi:ATP-binding protein [Pseudobacteroides cellulosolvens]|uniref:histidine kinase n=1 Tax=Pseudobacteroides cellulosolvens ATCC 35603 = DSM 2933 TaxID=398512 RepID=A0A0L6JLN3_9FIRM|nr:ATP-binding protein [Pseudobacteroides cellulosolvens]KNY26655.1 integral membrane sensor signal transduction histidine kinase [Pseudobacteroides cellulosolvens ATCC 35603 = DSM 2933]
MKIGLRYKILFTNVIVLFLTFLIVALVLIEGVDRVNREMLINNLVNQSEISVRTIKQSLLMDSDADNVEGKFNLRAGDFASRLSKESGIRVVIFSSQKKLLADSENSKNEAFSLAELEEAFKEAGNRAYSQREMDGEQKLFFAFPIMHSGKIIGGVLFVNSLSDIEKNKRNISILVLIAFLAGTIIILIVSIILSGTITKPLKVLNRSAMNISKGDYSKKIHIKTGDELGSLANTFNLMMDEVANKINSIDFEKAKLGAVLESMGEGVVAYNGDNEIIANNAISRNLFMEEQEDWTCGIVKQVRKSRQRLVVEINFNKRNLLVCATLLNHDELKDGVVLIINDITELRNLQEKQKNFITNVSHELKTPLTTILGYVDLLKEQGKDKKIFDTSIAYLESSAERLKRLVDDLIDLSSLKKFEFEIEKRSIDITGLIKDTVGQMALKAKKFNIEIETYLPHLEPIMVDPIRVKQAIVNILDNAIKHSKEGKISVKLYDNEGNVQLDIEDKGCGIPRDLIEKIFEPFYRVDKARSREIGGNGLGLSITREIVEKHNGEIIIDSIEGEGTTVSIILPYE